MAPGQVQTFYAQIAANRRRSALLMLAVFLLLGTLGFAIGFAYSEDPLGGVVAIVIALVVAGIMTSVSYFAGASLVLAASGARLTNDADQPRLMNVVREMSIAANVPVPKVYLIDDTAPNAFATGRDPQHASIAVTTGLLDKLDREELQGVIGHELSHVRNLDIRFALLVGVLVGSVVLMADFFLRSMWYGGLGRRGGSRRGGGGGAAIFVVIAIVLAIVAPLFARLIQFSVSRQREYLADASSVELTRNPVGLQRALLKIGADREALEVANRATQHMYFVNPAQKFEARPSGLFSTHPTVLERVNRLRALTGADPLDARTMSGLQGLV